MKKISRKDELNRMITWNKENYGWWKRENIHKIMESKILSTNMSLYIINHLVPILDKTYPNRYDIHLYRVYNFNKKSGSINRAMNMLGVPFHAIIPIVIIKFPEVIVKNKTNNKHTIRDMYVYIPFVYSGEKIHMNYISGIRGTVTNAELNAGYMFSHLPRKLLHTYKDSYFPCSFCTGSGEINNIKLMYNSENKDDMLQWFLLQLENYLAYESIEGGPYIKISDIGEKGTTLRNIDIPQSMYTSIFYTVDSILQSNIDFNIPLKIEKGIVKVDDTTDFLLSLYNILKNDYSENIFVAYKDSKGNFYNNREALTPPSEDELKEISNLSFQGEYFRLKVLTDVKEEITDNRKFLHPLISNYVINQFNSRIKKSLIENYLSNRFKSTSIS